MPCTTHSSSIRTTEVMDLKRGKDSPPSPLLKKPWIVLLCNIVIMIIMASVLTTLDTTLWLHQGLEDFTLLHFSYADQQLSRIFQNILGSSLVQWEKTSAFVRLKRRRKAHVYACMRGAARLQLIIIRVRARMRARATERRTYNYSYLGLDREKVQGTGALARDSGRN